jgi:outer membrane protein TolC
MKRMRSKFVHPQSARRNRGGSRLAFAAVGALAVSIALEGSAHATQPLEEFLEQSKTHSFDAREVEATLRQREAEAESAFGRLLPALSARGVYTRNQYEVAANFQGATLVIQPQDQLDAVFQLDVPLIDVGSYYRLRASRAIARSATEQREATSIDTQRAVSRAYFQLIGAYGLLQAAEKSVSTAESNLRDVEIRRSAGAATELDRERARAHVERARQDNSDAQLLVELSGRNLETLSGLTPTAPTAFPIDDLHPEPPLDQWLARAGQTPQDRVAREASEAATDQKRAATAAYLPTLAGSAQERLTNATGFSGRNATYLLQLTLSWRIDYSTVANSDAQSAARDVAAVREERAHRGVADAIFEAHRRVEAGIGKSRAARAQASAAAHAAELAHDRYTAGAATQLDVTQAQRDAVLADASRIQADADLFFARTSLRLASGTALSERRTSR